LSTILFYLTWQRNDSADLDEIWHTGPSVGSSTALEKIVQTIALPSKDKKNSKMGNPYTPKP